MSEEKKHKPNKDGKFWNCYMRQDIYDTLTRLSEETGMSKTAIVERAILRTAKEHKTEKDA